MNEKLILSPLTPEQIQSLVRQTLEQFFAANPVNFRTDETGKRVFDLDQFCDYTGIGKQTAYRLTSRGEVPHSKRGKRLYFDKAQVDAWLLANHVGGSAEADWKANEYIMTKQRAKRA